jgi:outer membrane lipase/esterase
MIRVSIAALAAATMLSVAAPASAQNYGRAVIFGDSLSDNGNLFATTGQPPAPYNRRFTNELVWAEYVFGPATGFTTTGAPNVNAGNINFAFGGARTDLGANSNGPVPGTPLQIGQFLGLGGRFAANDVASVWGGANNIFQTITPLVPQLLGGTVTSAQAQQQVGASATAAAGDVGAQVRQLAGAGARTIVVFNLPSFALTPQFNTTPIAALAGLGSSTFNGALQAQMAAAAGATGANIVSIPIDRIFDAVVANPGGFGLTNVTQQCLTTPACVGVPAARNSFLFWDGVHPTAAGHLLVAAAVREYLGAPSRAASVSAAFGEGAFYGRRAAGLAGLAQLSALSPAPGKWEVFVNATGSSDRGVKSEATSVIGGQAIGGGRSDTRDYGLRFGGLRNLGNGWTVGAMASVSLGTIKGLQGKMEADTTRFGIDLLGGWRSGGLFVNLNLGGGLDRYSDYAYRTIGPLKNTGATTAVSFNASAEVGNDYRFGAATLTPLARLSYVRATLDGFNEAGVVAPVAYDGRTVQALTGAAEAKLAYQFTQNLSGYALIGYEAALASSVDDVRGRLIGNTAQPFSYKMPDLAHPGVVAGLGAALKLGDWTAQASWRASFGEKGQQRHTGSVGFAVKF